MAKSFVPCLPTLYRFMDYKRFILGFYPFNRCNIRFMSSDGQGFEKPRGYTGMGTEGKGQGMDLKTLEKPVPSSRVTGYPWYLVRVSHFVPIIY